MIKTEIKAIQEMKERVCHENIRLEKSGLVVLTWGNVSEVNRELGVVVIKPSGVPYEEMLPEQMVVTDLEGNLLEENSLKPSSDLATHLVLYKEFEEVGAIVHTHSKYAVMWAQAGRDLLPYGTTHADTFYGSVPITRQLTEEEVLRSYEKDTGAIIVETFRNRKLNPLAVPAVLTRNHGPFTWAKTIEKAVENSIVLDEVAHMALGTEVLSNHHEKIPSYLLDKHYFRKHGENAYYGQG